MREPGMQLPRPQRRRLLQWLLSGSEPAWSKRLRPTAGYRRETDLQLFPLRVSRGVCPGERATSSARYIRFEALRNLKINS